MGALERSGRRGGGRGHHPPANKWVCWALLLSPKVERSFDLDRDPFGGRSTTPGSSLRRTGTRNVAIVLAPWLCSRIAHAHGAALSWNELSVFA